MPEIPKPPVRMGRPPIDSEELRARVTRPVLDALDAHIAETAAVGTRADAVRTILAAWLRQWGYMDTANGAGR